MRKVIISLIFLFLFAENGYNQSGIFPSKDSLIKNIVEQVLLLPQEKIYLQTDKPVYLSGEKIWFRAFLVDAALHRPVINHYLYIELINPLDSVVCRVKIRQDSSAYSGYIPINEKLPEGDYTICAYTENMLNLGEDFYFKKSIHIGSPFAATVQTEANFRFDSDDMLTAEVIFKDIRTRKKIYFERLTIRINDQPSRIVKMNDDTTAYFSFNLPAKNKKRIIYVETVRGNKYITIPFSPDDYDMSFFPEGGYMLEGVQCRVAVKALNSNGLPEVVTGRIVDDNGNEYAQVNTLHDGMGIFSLSPGKEVNYFAVCKNELGIEKRFKLPMAYKGMYSLKVETVDDKLNISVLQSSGIQEPTKLFLVIHTRGMVHYASPLDTVYSCISFNTDKFPSGILQIILLDGSLKPLSERLVFCRSNDLAQVEFTTGQNNYLSRQQVKAGIKVVDSSGMPQDGSCSVSITDDNDVKPDSITTILTTLLLTSDLKGYIYNPAYYFQENNPEATKALDLLMLTNGWRRYNIPDVARGIYTDPLFPAKYGMEISGNVRSLILGKPLEKSQVSVFSWEAGYFDEKMTGKDGSFLFNGIEFQDSTKFVIQALNKNGNKGVDLVVNEAIFPRISGLPKMFSHDLAQRADEKQLGNYLKKAETRYSIEKGIRTIYLNEVVVTSKVNENDKYRFSYYMPKVSPDIITEKQIESYHPVNVSDILKYIPHVEIVPDENGMNKVIIRSMSARMSGEQYNYAALIIDDIIIHDYDIDMTVDPSNIERIAVLKGAQAVLLGSDGIGGAIVITTKNIIKAGELPKYNIKTFTPLGYQKPAEFYSPRYDTPEQRNSGQPDLRTTIYWNPNIALSSLGESVFDFFTADASTNYTVVIEGITNDGALFYKKEKISRK